MRRYPSVSPFSLSFHMRRCSFLREVLPRNNSPYAIETLLPRRYSKNLLGSSLPKVPYAGIKWSQALLFFVQYAFHPGEVTEQVGKLFQLSFEPKIRLFRVCSISVTSCLQARDCTVCISVLSQVTFAAVLLRLRQRNSLGQNTDIVSADITAMQFYDLDCTYHLHVSVSACSRF